MLSSENRKSQIDSFRENVIKNYEHLWEAMIAEWSCDSSASIGWLMYSANYLFRTNNIRWAVDPFLLSTRVPAPFWQQQIADLAKLDFVLLTHRHNDHFDRGLVQALKDYPIQWIVPQELLDDFLELLPQPQKIIVAQSGERIICAGINITPFTSLHFQEVIGDKLHGVSETGYLVESGEKKWLFPGDIRNYRAELLPKFGSVDVLFAHLWLGRKSAEEDSPQLLEQFCEFCLALHPSRIVVTHLYEVGRKANNLWDLSHFRMVKKRLQEFSPHLPIDALLMGQKIQI